MAEGSVVFPLPFFLETETNKHIWNQYFDDNKNRKRLKTLL